MCDVVLIGLGNLLLSDEGVGIHLLRRFAAQADRRPGVEMIDAGDSGMRVLHAIVGRRKAVLVDCAFMGAPPGELLRFRPEEVRSNKALARRSLHEGDLLHFLDLSRALGQAPAEIVIFGIQPADLSPGETLSPELTARLEEYAQAIAAELDGCADA